MGLISSLGAAPLAKDLHCLSRESVVKRPFSPSVRMNREYQTRFVAGFLVLMTAAAITLGWINFRKERQFVAPYDGVWWVERNGQIFADKVAERGPAYGWIKPGDRLT